MDELSDRGSRQPSVKPHVHNILPCLSNKNGDCNVLKEHKIEVQSRILSSGATRNCSISGIPSVYVSSGKSSKIEGYMILGYIWFSKFDPDQCRYKEKEAPRSCSSYLAGSGSDSIMHFSQQAVALPDQFYPGKRRTTLSTSSGQAHAQGQ
ncbi:hypothetical protein OPV22_027685 [Ensete ventricosum]|uniref:Uncharacterized protein n=1 Tax=Ensete ventricosum TaxID=4639 RepID=A0AAV8Q4D4_ENSVE|nr:hypothetical protein OPV22_027685 [Ensete ventricosum]